MAGTDDQRCAVLTVAIADYDGPRIPVTPVHDAGVAFADLFEGPDGRPQHISLNHRLGPRMAEAEVRCCGSPKPRTVDHRNPAGVERGRWG